MVELVQAQEERGASPSRWTDTGGPPSWSRAAALLCGPGTGRPAPGPTRSPGACAAPDTWARPAQRERARWEGLGYGLVIAPERPGSICVRLFSPINVLLRKRELCAPNGTAGRSHRPGGRAQAETRGNNHRHIGRRPGGGEAEGAESDPGPASRLLKTNRPRT